MIANAATGHKCDENIVECELIKVAIINISRHDNVYTICPPAVCNHTIVADCKTVNSNTGGILKGNHTELGCIRNPSERFEKCSLVLYPLSCNGFKIPQDRNVSVIYEITDDGHLNMTRTVMNINWELIWSRDD